MLSREPQPAYTRGAIKIQTPSTQQRQQQANFHSRRRLRLRPQVIINSNPTNFLLQGQKEISEEEQEAETGVETAPPPPLLPPPPVWFLRRYTMALLSSFHQTLEAAAQMETLPMALRTW
jgi:hypothetical protein